MKRRNFLGGMAAFALATTPTHADTLAAAEKPLAMVRDWYGLMLELVRHTPTYTPPVASRAFAYIGVTIYEAVASGNPKLKSLAGQLQDLKPLPRRDADTHDDTVILQAALSTAALQLFSNTGPTGQRALKAMHRITKAKATAGVASDVEQRSTAFGLALAQHVLDWSKDDGGHVIDNMGFATDYKGNNKPGDWVPTSPVAIQQMPLLPTWGSNRCFALPGTSQCSLPPPPAYSEDTTSEFHRQALEVYEVVQKKDPEQRMIARYWADDPMLSATPPGHWIEIVLALAKGGMPLETTADVLVRLGVAVADGFIACWHDKFEYRLLRPITYIRKHIDPAWTPPLITPPFPEYPSGHSTQSGAAEAALTAFFGDNFPFEDATRSKDGLPIRNFPSFRAAAQEAGMSRLYGGIHFRAAIERGLEQGRCVGAHAVALKTSVS